jgi:hypothetical protein
VSEQGTRRETFAPQEKKPGKNLSYCKFLRTAKHTSRRKGRKSFKNSCFRKATPMCCKFSLRIFAAALDRAAVNQEAGTYLPEALYFSSSPRRNS